MTDDMPIPTDEPPAPSPATVPDITDDGEVPGEDDPAVIDQPPTEDNA